MDIPFKAVVDALNIGVLFIDVDNRIVYCNELGAGVWGRSKEELLGQSVLDCHPVPSRERVGRILEGFRQGKAGGHARMKDRSGRFVEEYYAPVYDEAGSYLGAVLASSDVTAKERARRRLEAMAIKDEQTGLYNRDYFVEVFADCREQLGLRLSSLALVMADVNGLKAINDRLGHTAGDEVIVNAAELIRNCVRRTDMVFRLGGDEFVVLIHDGDERIATGVYRRIKAACKRWNDEHPQLPISLGVGWKVVRDPAEVAKIFADADAAMYLDKKREKGQAAAVTAEGEVAARARP